MKKFLSLTLAAAMAASVASVAFAADAWADADKDKNYHNFDIVSEPVTDEVEEAPDQWIYGDTICFKIYASNTKEQPTKALANADAAKKIKLSADWQMNGDLVESVKVMPVMHGKNGEYVIAIETKEMPNETDDSDVIGTITIKTPKSNDLIAVDGGSAVAKYDTKEVDLEVAFNLANKDAKSINEPDDNKDLNKTADDNYLYKFEDDNQEEEEHEIELYGDMGRFVVNTIGQGDLVINTNVEYNKGIEGAASDVNYVYFNGNNATFNRLGDLYLNAEEGNILYRVNKDGSLTKMPTEYDDDEEAFVVRTRVLGSYVIAEEELDLEKVNAAVVEAPEAPVAPVAPSNPSTGAAC